MVRAVAGPPGVVDVLLPVVAAAATLAAFAAPGRFDRVYQAAAALWGLTAVGWALRLLGRAGERLGEHAPDRPSMAARPLAVRMAAAPALLALCVGLVSARLPLKAGFIYSRPGFDRLAQLLPTTPRGELRAGLYHLHYSPRADARGGTPVVHLSAVGDALAEDRQFAYLPDAAAADDPRYTHLGGGWYLFRR